MPIRIQRRRTKGWKMPPGAVYVGRTSAESCGLYANPFRIGGYYKMGTPGRSGFSWLQTLADYADASFTKIETPEQAVEWFREYRKRYPYTEAQLAQIRGEHLACWCPLHQACHADVLLELASVSRLREEMA